MTYVRSISAAFFLATLVFVPSISAQVGSNKYCALHDALVPPFGTSDGPAALPSQCYFTKLNATNPSWPNSESGNAPLQVSNVSTWNSAVAAVQCGDIIEFNAGTSIQTSTSLLFPQRDCSAGKYITIRTGGYASLPGEASRVTPCYAGVASLPGRPNFNCVSTTNVMAKIQSTSNVAPLKITAGTKKLRV